jgi:hypothetical protein
MVLYVLAKTTYEISRASFLPLRVATLGRSNRDKIHDQLVRLENQELLRLNIQGYFLHVKRARHMAGQSVFPPPSPPSIPLFLYSSIPLFLYSSIPLFLYSSIPLFLYSSRPPHLMD